MNPEVKKVITESVLNFLNESKRWEDPRKFEVSIVKKGTPTTKNNPSTFRENPSSLNEQQIREIEEIRKDLEKSC
jgi:hypothetical protein